MQQSGSREVADAPHHFLPLAAARVDAGGSFGGDLAAMRAARSAAAGESALACSAAAVGGEPRPERAVEPRVERQLLGVLGTPMPYARSMRADTGA
jgi:hypothetical protein